MRKLSKRQIVLYLMLAFLPAVLYSVHMIILYLTGHQISLVPTISDELFWYHQITGMVDSGLPLGYYGYNGRHAVIGNLGPWGPAILLPYVVWGKLFGFELYSMFIANIAFLGIGLSVFAYLTKPTEQELLYIVAAYSTLLFNLHYCATAMAEPLHYALAMILMGCMIRMIRQPCGRWFTYGVVPLLLIYGTQAYLLLALFVPVYLMIVLKIKPFMVKLAVNAGITLAFAFSMRKIFHLLQVTYNVSMRTGTWKELLIKKLNNAVGVLSWFFPTVLWKNRTTAHGFLSLMILTYIAVFAAVLIMLVLRGKSRRMEVLLSGYLLCGTLACFCLFYPNPSMWTLCRGINAALCCAVLCLALQHNKKVVLLCIMCAVISLPSLYLVSENNQRRRELSTEQRELYASAQEKFSAIMHISKEHSLWENTIAQYGSRKDGTPTVMTLALPRSAGYNIMLDTSVISEAGYAVVYHSFPKKETLEEVLTRLQDAGYRIIEENDTLTLLKRQ